jgi:hypothetical protein
MIQVVLWFLLRVCWKIFLAAVSTLSLTSGIFFCGLSLFAIWYGVNVLHLVIEYYRARGWDVLYWFLRWCGTLPINFLTYLCELFTYTICKFTEVDDDSLWDSPFIKHLDCERKLRPWYAWKWQTLFSSILTWCAENCWSYFIWVISSRWFWAIITFWWIVRFVVRSSGWFYRMRWLPFWHWCISRVSLRLPWRTSRSFEKDFSLLTMKLATNHSHPECAMRRNAAAQAIYGWVERQGMSVYAISKSRRESQFDGFHGLYMDKDFTLDPTRDPITDRHILVFIDSDYYVELSDFAYHEQPMVMYTFVPQEVAGQAHGYNWCINDKDEVEYTVNGARTYKHQLWDYSGDFMTFDYPDKSIIYRVDYRFASPDDINRRIVVFTPVRMVLSPWNWFVSGKRLQRQKFFEKGFVTLESSDENGTRWFSVARASSFCSAKICRKAWDSLIQKCWADGVKSSYNITGWLGSLGVEYVQSQAVAAMISAYIEEGLGFIAKACNPYAGHIGKAPPNYTVIGAQTDEEKSIGRLISVPLVEVPATVPSSSAQNSAQGVRGRVIDVRNDIDPPNRFHQYAKEFRDFMVPKPGCVTPWSVTDVVDTQVLAPQRARNARTLPWMHRCYKCVVRAFMKQETTNDYGDARNISQVPTEQSLSFAKFTYGLKVLLEGLDFYMPSKSPEEIARKLLTSALHNQFLTEADGSRFDGRVSKFLQELVRSVFKRAFSTEFHEEIDELFENELNPIAYTDFGQKYEVGFSRLSGSGQTTVGNTIISAYLDYCSHRESGKKPQEAWKSLCAYAGDDMVSTCAIEYVEAASKTLGMSHKCIKHTGNTPVGFLGRKFPRLFEGDYGSLQDFPRTLGKIHITFSSRSIPLSEAAINKAQGYSMLDPVNPVVKSWCDMIERVYNVDNQHEFDPMSTDIPYSVRSMLSAGGGDGDWMGWPQLAEEHVMLALTQQSDWSEDELTLLISQMDMVNCLEDMAYIVPLGKIAEPPKNPVYITDDPFTVADPATGPNSSLTPAADLTAGKRKSDKPNQLPDKKEKREKRAATKAAVNLVNNNKT